MAGEDTKKKQKRKKRDEDTFEQGESSKAPRTKENESAKVELQELNSSWKNLQLILSLLNKSKDLAEKIHLAFEFVESSSKDDTDCPNQVVDTSRMLVSVNNWDQLVLISSEKGMRPEVKEYLFETPGSCFDIRCWKILRFCLEESKKLRLSLSCFRDLLRVIRCIVADALFSLKDVSVCFKEKFPGPRMELYNVVLDCIPLVFLFHGGVANENLDLWIFLMEEVLGLIVKVLVDQHANSQFGKFVLQLTCYLLEPLAKFLRVHPTRKNGFRDFIDKLLEPLMHLLYLLRSSSSQNNNEVYTNLSKLVEEVLAQGLFHSTHIDGFLSSHNSTKYKSSSDAAVKVDKLVNKSYHKHLFDKVEKIVSEKKGLALAGLGDMLHLFLSCAIKHKGSMVNGGVSGESHVSTSSHVLKTQFPGRTIVPQKKPGYLSMDAELRKAIFDYFVKIMEYLLADLNKYHEFDMARGDVSLNVLSTLRSISNLLANLNHDKVYIRTEDISEGAFKTFLRLIYDTIMSFSTRVTHLQTSTIGADESSYRDLLISVRKELIVTVHHLLDVEYEVVGDDLENLWTMVFSSVACSFSSTDLDEAMLFPDILSLGCKLIDLYSELRQVDSSIFALCRAVKHTTVLLGDSEVCVPSHSYSSYSNSLSKLLCSSGFRLSLSNAIKAIPEGQAAGLVRQLNSEITESLEWINLERHIANLSESSSLRAEVLGKVLSDMYTIILDSVSVSSGNSSLFCASLMNLIKAVRPSASKLILALPNRCENSSADLDGYSLSKGIEHDKVSTCWILVFLFRLLLSCRCVFQQVISLMPPDTLKKKLGVIDDSFTAYSWRDWSEMSGRGQEGFFTWTLLPSFPLLSIIRAVSDICIQDSVVICPPLAYVLHVMALQRLADLNLLVKSSEYMLQWNQNLSQKELKETSELPSYRKRTKKWKKCAEDIKQEAADLTKFILGYILTVDKDQISCPSFDDANGDKIFQGLRDYNSPDFAVGHLDSRILPFTLWWIICEDIDLWCSHAAKKDLKNFLTILIQAFVSSESDNVVHIDICNADKANLLKRVAAHQIALKFMSNTMSHEQGSIRRYMASRVCKVLQDSVLSVYTSSGVNLSKLPDWADIMSVLEHASDVGIGELTWPDMGPAKFHAGQISTEFARCHCLLALVTQLPREYLSSRSSSLYITCVLNLERLLVGSMLGRYEASGSPNLYEILRLFVSCRRVLKFLATTSCMNMVNGGQPVLASILSDNSFPLLWLLRSLYVVIGFQRSLPEEIAFKAIDATYSLMDHTSYVFQTVTRYWFQCSIRSSKKLRRRRKRVGSGSVESDVLGNDLHVDNSLKSVLQLVEVISEQIQTSLTSIKDAPYERVETLAGFHELNKLTSILACFQGVLQGLVSALNRTVVDGNTHIKDSSYFVELLTKIDPCVATCIDSATFVLKAFFLDTDHTLNMSTCGGNTSGSGDTSFGDCDVSDDASDKGEMSPADNILPFNVNDHLDKCNLKQNTKLAIEDLESFQAEVQRVRQCLRKPLLMEIVRGENPEVTLFLQQLFSACSAILRLNLLAGIRSLPLGLFPIVVGISEFLLLEFASSTEMPHLFNFYCLNAVMEFLEVLGSYFPLIDPMLSRDFYVELVDLHIKAIGKCILLQGKESKLASQDTGSPSKMPTNDKDACSSISLSQLGEFKRRLRTSFVTYVKESCELHLPSVVQAVERALVGVQEGCSTSYQVVIRSSNIGEVASFVAAGIDCLDLVLELTAGHKRFSIKDHIQSFIACLFNIILHLQAPSVFLGDINCTQSNVSPDPGSVILMCIGTLATISGKPTFFQIEAGHISQILRVPGALFQHFLQLQLPISHFKPPIGITNNNNAIDRKFSMDLYAGCCRLLCTALKHHNSESRQCIALLQDSVSVLLHCLEIVNTDVVAGRYSTSAWEVQEAVKCAAGLRRVYEELRQQKDIFGQSSYLFLSTYIWVYCGLGPARRGIIREVDESLRPGVYALIDSCSADDLQLLHTTFGEGPCRSTLATLQHDYKHNYQYEGKA